MADEVLSVELQLLDSVTSPARRVQRALGNATEGMFTLSRGALSLTRSLQLVDDATGKTASTFDALQAIGVTTTGEIQNQIAALDVLISKTKMDAVATAQLTARQQGLKNQLAGTSGSMRGSTTSALDAQQAITGLSRAVRGGSVSIGAAIPGLLSFQRNIQAVGIRASASGKSIKEILVGALKGGGGLALALTAAGIAFELFSRKAKDAKVDIEGVASSLLKIPSLAQIEFGLSTAKEAIAIQEKRVALFKEAGRQALVAATNAGVSVPVLTKIKSLLAVTSQRHTRIADEFRKQVGTLEEQAIVAGILVSLGGKRVVSAKNLKGELAAIKKLLEGSNQLVDHFVGQLGLAPGVLKDALDIMVQQKRAIESALNVIDRPSDIVFDDPGRSSSTELKQINDLLKKTQKNILAIEVGKNFLDPFAQGLSDVILQLGTVNDLLDGMKRAFADLLALGIKGAIGAGIGALFGNPLAGLAIATGGVIGRQQVLPGQQALAGQQQLVAVVKGTDLLFILTETAAQEGS